MLRLILEVTVARSSIRELVIINVLLGVVVVDNIVPVSLLVTDGVEILVAFDKKDVVTLNTIGVSTVLLLMAGIVPVADRFDRTAMADGVVSKVDELS